MRVIYIDKVAVNVDHIERYYYEFTLDAVVVVFSSGHKAITDYRNLEEFENAIRDSKEL